MNPVKKLQHELKKDKGVRVGQTAVVSRKVHTINLINPTQINIIANSDAGQAFYHRLQPNEIIHLDLFHEVKTFNLKQFAVFLIKALERSPFSHLMDYIDIQTGSGGGRLTGDLCYGTSENLKKSHLNHVHIAALIPEDELESIFLIVDNIEQALLEQGVELRKIEKISHEIGNAPLDIFSCASNSDSNLMHDPNFFWKQGFKEIVEAIEQFGGLKQIEEVLEAFQSEENYSIIDKKCSDFNDIVKYLEEGKFVSKKQSLYYLTPKGEKFVEIFRKNRRELENILKKMIRTLPKHDNYKGVENIVFSKKPSKKQMGPSIFIPYDPEEWTNEINVPETIRKSLVRSYFESSRFFVKEEDIVCIKRNPQLCRDICLIIDASASMAGNRLRNAKYLAKHLILMPHTRISILAFQEKQVSTFVPFTKNYEKLEDSLDKITATGLTPLALGLSKGAEYMNRKNLKNPLIILITDGIPTVPLWTSDPVNDAISAASNILDKKIDFCCIGLQPNKDYLVKITSAAKGYLYVLDELKREVLVDVVRQSYKRL